MCRLLVSLSIVVTLNSCIYMHTTSQTYQATGAAPDVGGAQFRAEFIPRGSEAGMTLSAVVLGGATVTETGPYQLRLHAFGRKGDQRWFRVTRFVLSVPGRLNAPMDKRGFEGRTDFEPIQNGEATRASLLFGTKIYINTEHRDKEVIIEADVEVMGRRGLRRGTIRLPLHQSKAGRSESYFIPTEIVKSFRAETPADIPNALPPPPNAP